MSTPPGVAAFTGVVVGGVVVGEVVAGGGVVGGAVDTGKGVATVGGVVPKGTVVVTAGTVVGVVFGFGAVVAEFESVVELDPMAVPAVLSWTVPPFEPLVSTATPTATTTTPDTAPTTTGRLSSTR